MPVLRRVRIIQHALNDYLARVAEVIGGDVQADFAALDRLLQVGNQAAERLALLLELHSADNQHRDKIHAVIKEVILAQGGVSARFNRQRAGNALFVQADGLVDDVAVAALVAVMFAAPVVDELLEA